MITTEDIVGRYVMVNGARTHYDELGSGTPLLLIHTLYACSLEWARCMPLLAEHGFHCVAIDLPGNSRSYPPNWTPLKSGREYGDFLAEFITTVFGGSRVVVAGSSIGGNLAVDLALRHSSKLLAAIAFEGAIFTPTVAPLDGISHPASAPGLHDIIERASIESLAPGTDPAIVEELRWQHRFTGNHVGIGQIRVWSDQDLRDHAGPVKCPLLVLYGEHDFYVPPAVAELTRDLIPNCEVRRLPGVGHYPMVEDPQASCRIIADFVHSHLDA